MKPRFRLALLGTLLAVIASFAPAAFAQQATFASPKLVVNTSFLNVRTGPGVQYSILITVVGGTELPVLGAFGDDVWYQVATDAGPGWVNVEFTLPRGEFSRVPKVAAPELVFPTPGAPQNLGQGGGGGTPMMSGSRRFTGVVVLGGNLYAQPGSDQLVLRSALNVEPDVVLPLLNQTRLPNGENWYQVNVPPFGVGWVDKIAFRPLECGTDYVVEMIGEAPIRFDGIANRDSYLVPKGTEFYVLGNRFEFVLVEDINGMQGLLEPQAIAARPDSVISRCDLIPTGGAAGVVDPSLGQGGGGAPASTPVPALSGNRVVVNTGNLNVRTGPGAAFGAIAVVPGGTTLAALAVTPDGEWMLVAGSFGQGWVDTEFVLFRGVYSTLPIISYADAAAAALSVISTPVAALGQGGGGGTPMMSGSRRFTGVVVLGGNLYAQPGSDQLVLRSALNVEPDVVLPLLNQTRLPNGENWYQVNVPPFGVGWVDKIAFRPLECGTDYVVEMIGEAPIRFDGIANRDSYLVPKGTEFYVLGNRFEFVLVEDINGMQGLLEPQAIAARPDSVISRCDLIPTGGAAGVVDPSLGQGGGGAPASTPVPALSGNRVVVNTGNLNVRTGPGAAFGAIAVVPGGTTLAALAVTPDGEWMLVAGSFGQGWVDTEFVLFRGVYSTLPIINY